MSDVTKGKLLSLAEQSLKDAGWVVERVPRGEKGSRYSSVRKIKKDGLEYLASIRTTKDCWFAFHTINNGKNWKTLDDVDYVIASSCKNDGDISIVKVHMMPASEVRTEFDKNYAAKIKSGHTVSNDTPIWLSLYDNDDTNSPLYAGAGLGQKHKPLTITAIGTEKNTTEHFEEDETVEFEGISIQEAKRRLSIELNVPESSIKISIEY